MAFLKFYVGPTLVKEAAARVRAAGIKVEIEGTEHVYVPEGTDTQALLKAVGFKVTVQTS